MSSGRYEFLTKWKVKATCDQVYTILSEAEKLPEWWPSVYLDVRITAPGDENNVGKKVKLYTKGWLPYTLYWNFVVTETHRPFGFTIKAFGDFVGEGIWTFSQSGDECDVTFSWILEVEKPLLKNFSFVLKPIFEANHKWAMKQGEKSLKLELLRRYHANGNSIPPPPHPTFPHNLMNNKKLQ